MKKISSLSVVAALLVILAAACQNTPNRETSNQEAPDQKSRNQEALNQEAPEKEFTADRHKSRGVTCGACHDGEANPKTAASPKSCLTCKNHGSWDIVAERISSNKEYKVNPHRNHISEAYDIECTFCHQSHEADVMICHDCHQGLEVK